MTREEAINVINQVRGVIIKDPSWMEEATRVVNEAADMAIKALEAQELDSGNGEHIATNLDCTGCRYEFQADYCCQYCDRMYKDRYAKRED